MFKSILAATDASVHAEKAMVFAADLAKKYDAELILLNVTRDIDSEDVPVEYRIYAEAEHFDSAREALESIGRLIVQDAEKIAHDHGAPHILTMVEVGEPASTILRVAEMQGVDLIIMGRRGIGTLKGLLLGSVSQKVSHVCKCTCMTVK